MLLTEFLSLEYFEPEGGIDRLGPVKLKKGQMVDI